MLYAYVNEKIVPESKATLSIYDRGLVLGDGLFETLRAIKGKPQFLTRHYKRLCSSAKRLRIRVTESEMRLEQIIKQLCHKSKLADASVRITLTRGKYVGGLSIDPRIKPSLIMAVFPVTGLPDHLYHEGVDVAITSINKSAASGVDSKVKTTNYLANIFAKAEADEKKCYEGILLGAKGDIAELSTSSFFCVMGNALCTPPIEAGILPGITRQVVLELAKKNGIQCTEKLIFPKDIGKMREAFLTSSVRGLLPIKRIEGQLIGRGEPGDFYLRLKKLYRTACGSYPD